MGEHGLNAHLFFLLTLQRFVSFYNDSMKLFISILMLVFVVGCNESTTPDTEDRTKSQVERYADFSYSAIAHSVYTHATKRTKRTRVAFTFIPSKLGAFMIVTESDQEKVVLTDGVFQESVFEFGPVSSIVVYWSDGKQIERTMINLEYE